MKRLATEKKTNSIQAIPKKNEKAKVANNQAKYMPNHSANSYAIGINGEGKKRRGKENNNTKRLITVLTCRRVVIFVYCVRFVCRTHTTNLLTFIYALVRLHTHTHDFCDEPKTNQHTNCVHCVF